MLDTWWPRTLFQVRSGEVVLERYGVDQHISEPAARPKVITVLDSIPLTEIGKPFKPALREAAAAQQFRDELVAQGIEGVEVGIGHEAGRLVVRLTGGGEVSRAVAALYGYDVDLRAGAGEEGP